MNDNETMASCEACGLSGVPLRTVDAGGYRVDLCEPCAGALKFPEGDDVRTTMEVDDG